MSKAVIVGSATDNVTKSAVSYLAQKINEGDNVFSTKTFLTAEEAQIVSNKTFDDTNTFPDTVASKETVETLQTQVTNLSTNAVTKNGSQTVKNKTFDSSNKFPDTVVTTDDEQSLTNKQIDSVNCYFSQRKFSYKQDDNIYDVILPNSGNHMNLVDADTKQSIENKTFKSSNTFPDTLATTAQLQALEARVKALEDAANGTEE